MVDVKTAQAKSLVPPVVEGDAATKILADFQRKATALEIEVVQRAVQNRLKRRNRAGKAGMEFVID